MRPKFSANRALGYCSFGLGYMDVRYSKRSGMYYATKRDVTIVGFSPDQAVRNLIDELLRPNRTEEPNEHN